MTIEELVLQAEKAVVLKGIQLFLTAGKRPTIRLNDTLEELVEEEMVHVQDLKVLVEQLLTTEELLQLEEKGDVSRSIGKRRQFRCHIVKSIGSFNLVIDL